MGYILSKLTMISKNNAFKNNGVLRDTLIVPGSIGAGVIYTNTVTFNISDDVDFFAAFANFTNYSTRLFAGPPFTSYDNKWWDLNQVQNVFMISSAGVINGTIIMTVSGSTVTLTLRISRQGTTAVTITSGGNIPVSVITYSLAT